MRDGDKALLLVDRLSILPIRKYIQGIEFIEPSYELFY